MLAPHFQVISLDVRNAGQSRVAIGADDDWSSYTGDHLALLAHLGVTRCHVMGACIGVLFGFALAEAQPGLVTSLVLQNPIGLWNNRPIVQGEYDQWAAQVGSWPGVDAALLPALGQRMFGGDFLYSVSRESVAACKVPVLLMPGDDGMHPAETSADIARLAPQTEMLAPWKGVGYRDAAMARVLQFFVEHRPGAVSMTTVTRPAPARVFRRVMDALALMAEIVVICALVVDVVLTFVNTALRYAVQLDMPWVPDASLILISIITFLGAPAFFRRSRSMAYTALVDRLQHRARRGLEATGLWAWSQFARCPWWRIQISCGRR